MKKYLEAVPTIIATIFLFGLIGFFAYTVYEDRIREEAKVAEIANAGFVKVLKVDVENEVVVIETPKGSRKVRAKFSDKPPSAGETWKITSDRSLLKFLQRQ